MRKDELVRSLRTFNGGASMMKQSDVARYIGINKNIVSDYLNGVDCFVFRRAKFYAITDVASRIMEQRQCLRR